MEGKNIIDTTENNVLPSETDCEKEKNTSVGAKEYSEKLWDQHLKFSEFVDEGFFLVETNSRQIVRTNTAATYLTGYSTEELLNLKIDQLHPEEELPILLLKIQQLEFESTTIVEDFTLVQKNGWKFPVNIHLNRLFDQATEPQQRFFVAIYRGEFKDESKITFSQRNHELLALMEIGRTIASALNLEEVIDLSMLKLASVCGAKYVSIFLVNENNELQMLKAHKLPPEMVTVFAQPWRVGIEEGPFEQVLKSRKILQVENVYTNPIFQKWRPIAERIGYAAVISLPMIPRDKPVGIFNLYYEKPHRFTQEQINFLRAAVTYLAISIDNARLYREHKEKADQITVINQITNSINSSLELEQVIKTIALGVRQVVDFDYLSIVLFDDETDKLQVFALASKKLATIIGEQFWTPLGKTGLGWLRLTSEQTPVLPESHSPRDSYESKLLIENTLKSRLNVLLLSKDKYLGTFSLGKLEAGAYTSTHSKIFKQIASQIATALENAKLYQEVKRRLTEFSALADVSQTISSSLNIREVLDLIVKAAATAMHAKICTIWFVNENSGLGHVDSNSPNTNLQLQKALHKRLDTVIKDMKPLMIENFQKEGLAPEELPNALRGANLRSYLGVPVISRGKTIAVLSVYKEDLHHFDDREVKLLSTIANQAAIAIENARLYERERRRAAQLAMVNEIGKKITSTLDLNKLLDIVSKAIQEIFKYYNVAIYLVDSKQDNIVLKSQSGGLSSKLPIGSIVEDTEVPIGRAITTGKTLLISDLSQEAHPDVNYPLQGSELCVPLKIADRIIGVLVLLSERKNAFDDRDLNAFEALAGQMASAIENARLFEETKCNTEQLAHANEELENFVFTVSHDLKAPIVSVQGFSSILLNDYRDRLDKDGVHYLQRIQSNVTQMERLIHDLLELSRIGRVVNPFEDTDINEIIKLALYDLQFQSKEKNIEIVIQPNLPVVYCDRDRILQVFTNLISNAIKYMGDNPAPRIEIGCEEKDNYYQFYVKDNGIGIDPKYHTKVFELFETLKEIKNVEGTGVGLTIVRRIINNHNGKVWIDSEKGKGSTFYFTLPKKH